MTHRGTVATKLEALREMAGEFASKSQALLGRADQRGHQNPYTMTNMGVAMSKKRIRLISVVLYVVSVSLGAFILAVYYWVSWEPDTSKLFKRV